MVRFGRCIWYVVLYTMGGMQDGTVRYGMIWQMHMYAILLCKVMHMVVLRKVFRYVMVREMDMGGPGRPVGSHHVMVLSRHGSWLLAGAKVCTTSC